MVSYTVTYIIDRFVPAVVFISKQCGIRYHEISTYPYDIEYIEQHTYYNRGKIIPEYDLYLENFFKECFYIS